MRRQPKALLRPARRARLQLHPPSHQRSIARSLCREGSRRSRRSDAGEQVRFLPGKAEHFRQRLQGVRTFGQQLKHVAASNYLIWSPITGEKAPDTVNDGKGPDNMTAKADIIRYLKDSFAFGHKAVATLNASNLVQPITSSSGRPTTRLFLATFAAAHCFDHYGQMVEYLRMNGIVLTGKPRPVVPAGINGQ